MLKPQLANDADLDSLQYPVYFQPKIDGVRAMNLTGILTGRSLDPFKGFGITEYFSKPEFQGLDGEMILGNDPKNLNRLCSLTTGAMGKFKGVTAMPDLHWYVFDLITEFTAKMTYAERYDALTWRVSVLKHPRVHLVPNKVCNNREELDAAIAEAFDQGYEGGIIRNPRALAKPGRPSKVKQELVRVKSWIDSEMLVTGITEGNHNTNEAEINSLGHTERSSAQDGMVPNGMVGSIQGIVLQDILDPFTGKVLFAKGLPITIATGEMTEEEAAYYFQNPDKIVKHIVKFKHMTHGVKDKPRFGNYISHRLPEDMS